MRARVSSERESSSQGCDRSANVIYPRLAPRRAAQKIERPNGVLKSPRIYVNANLSGGSLAEAWKWHRRRDYDTDSTDGNYIRRNPFFSGFVFSRCFQKKLENRTNVAPAPRARFCRDKREEETRKSTERKRIEGKESRFTSPGKC